MIDLKPRKSTQPNTTELAEKIVERIGLMINKAFKRSADGSDDSYIGYQCDDYTLLFSTNAAYGRAALTIALRWPDIRETHYEAFKLAKGVTPLMIADHFVGNFLGRELQRHAAVLKELQERKALEEKRQALFPSRHWRVFPSGSLLPPEFGGWTHGEPLNASLHFDGERVAWTVYTDEAEGLALQEYFNQRIAALKAAAEPAKKEAA
jgi:hypothetical protein